MDRVEKAREELEEILSDQEYRVYYEDNRNFLEILWDNVTSWIGDLFSNWFSSLNPANGFASFVLFMIVIVVLVLVGMVLLLSIRSIRRKRALRDHQPLKVMNQMDWSVERHLLEARKQEEAKNYTLALRHMFLALLLNFHEGKWLVAKPWKTNWEYFDELQRKDKNRAEVFFQHAHLFDEVVYGKRPIGESEYVGYRKEVDQWIQGQSTDCVQKEG
ncbi:protein of unknown function [Oceanobacillus limi]|uniref:Uncharacterized protein n=1 Tax=Oceanobacillus limi TaxID=930131 RepID=A0A1I0EZK9_9BACI|nr:DUF4129 domain-containing protein [Oceanobacillus limi]SET50563.1 protein of unknown function [Oceanobacillus limi]